MGEKMATHISAVKSHWPKDKTPLITSLKASPSDQSPEISGSLLFSGLRDMLIRAEEGGEPRVRRVIDRLCQNSLYLESETVSAGGSWTKWKR